MLVDSVGQGLGDGECGADVEGAIPVFAQEECAHVLRGDVDVDAGLAEAIVAFLLQVEEGKSGLVSDAGVVDGEGGCSGSIGVVVDAREDPVATVCGAAFEPDGGVVVEEEVLGFCGSQEWGEKYRVLHFVYHVFRK